MSCKVMDYVLESPLFFNILIISFICYFLSSLFIYTYFTNVLSSFQISVFLLVIMIILRLVVSFTILLMNWLKILYSSAMMRSQLLRIMHNCLFQTNSINLFMFPTISNCKQINVKKSEKGFSSFIFITKLPS